VFNLTDVAGSFHTEWAGAAVGNQAPMLAVGLAAITAGLRVSVWVDNNNVIAGMMLMAPGQ